MSPGTTVPTGEIWAGNPAKMLRKLDADEREFIKQSAANYALLADIHASENAKTPEEIEVSYAAFELLDPITPEPIKLQRGVPGMILDAFLSWTAQASGSALGFTWRHLHLQNSGLFMSMVELRLQRSAGGTLHVSGMCGS